MAPEEESVAADPVLGAAFSSAGFGLIDPFVSNAPVVPVPTGRVFLVGAAGGVGVSTLARLAGDDVGEGFDPARLAGLAGFREAGFYGGVPYGAPVWVVSRVEGPSVDAAQNIAARWSQGLVPWTIAGLVLTYGPVPPAKEIIHRSRAVSRLFPQTVTFSWCPDRIGPDGQLPARERKTLAIIAGTTPGDASGEQTNDAKGLTYEN